MQHVIAKPGVARGFYEAWEEGGDTLDRTKGKRRYTMVSSLPCAQSRAR
jgi:hypothetical protein